MTPTPTGDALRLRAASLNRRATHPIDLRLEASAREALARDMGLLALPSLRLHGKLSPEQSDGWRLDAVMTADVVQPCVVSLAPVPAHLDEPVTRIFSPHVEVPAGGEDVEMRDDEIEPLGAFIDLAAIAAEALSLALPLYPRAADAALPTPSPEEAADDTRRPFADLGKLLRKDGD